MKKELNKSSEKYVTESTFEKNMRNIAGSFARVDASLELHGRILQEILKEIKNLHKDNKYVRQTLASFTGDVSSHDRKIENLAIRVERLELKTK